MAIRATDIYRTHEDLCFRLTRHPHDGEDERRKALRDCIQRRFGLRSEMPAYREVIES